MNIQEYSPETVFFISVFVAAIFGASVVLLAFRLFKGKKKTTPCVVVQHESTQDALLGLDRMRGGKVEMRHLAAP